MTSKGTEKMSEITVGVDISKDTLDAHRLPDGVSRSFANTPAGQKALIAWTGRAFMTTPRDKSRGGPGIRGGRASLLPKRSICPPWSPCASTPI